jgi:alkaline phosphatase D
MTVAKFGKFIGAVVVQLLSSLPSYSDVLPLPHPDQLIIRIAFGSCAFQSVEQPIFRTLVASQPDIYLSLGDAIYGDYDLTKKSVYEVTPASLRREWRVLADNPDWQHLVSHVPVMATWDNHDYGHHSAGAEFPLKSESADIFLDFFGEPEESARRRRPGVYDAMVFGPEGRRVQIILLDTRSFKSLPILAQRPEGIGGSLGKYKPNDNPKATLLGAAQWQWLERKLREPAQVRLIASSGQVVADQKGMDEWGNYPLERRRLFDLIQSAEAKNVLLLSGNVHFSEVSQTNEGPVRLVDFTASGLTHVNREYPAVDNSYRVAGPYVEPNFGLVEIDWEAKGGLAVALSVVGLDGEKAFEYQVSNFGN